MQYWYEYVYARRPEVYLRRRFHQFFFLSSVKKRMQPVAAAVSCDKRPISSTFTITHYRHRLPNGLCHKGAQNFR